MLPGFWQAICCYGWFNLGVARLLASHDHMYASVNLKMGVSPLVFVDGQMVVAPTVESFTTGETVTIVQTAILTQCVFPCNVPVLFDCVM